MNFVNKQHFLRFLIEDIGVSSSSKKIASESSSVPCHHRRHLKSTVNHVHLWNLEFNRIYNPSVIAGDSTLGSLASGHASLSDWRSILRISAQVDSCKGFPCSYTFLVAAVFFLAVLIIASELHSCSYKLNFLFFYGHRISRLNKTVVIQRSVNRNLVVVLVCTEGFKDI